MPAGMQIFNEAEQVVFDTNDRVLGGLYTITTTDSSGSHEPVLQPGQKAAFYFRLPGGFIPNPDKSSPWPRIVSYDDRVQWGVTTPGTGLPVTITVAIY